MIAHARSAGDTGARGKISGTISNGATWYEDVAITEDGAAVANADDWTWTLTLRERADDTTAKFTITTGSGLAISQGVDATVLQIRVARSLLMDLDGDYVCDIKSVDLADTTYDSAGRSIHWANGIVTVRNEPI